MIKRRDYCEFVKEVYCNIVKQAVEDLLTNKVPKHNLFTREMYDNIRSVTVKEAIDLMPNHPHAKLFNNLNSEKGSENMKRKLVKIDAVVVEPQIITVDKCLELISKLYKSSNTRVTPCANCKWNINTHFVSRFEVCVVCREVICDECICADDGVDDDMSVYVCTPCHEKSQIK